MCVVAVAWKAHPRWRVVLVGNRDEFHGRASAALARWPETSVMAGRDLQAGGTWVGVDGRGRCAVVTNVRDPLASAAAPRSRGELPLGFLSGETAARPSADRLAGLAGEYAPFNLLLMDADEAIHLGNHPRIETRRIEPGVHGMSNGGFDVPWPKTERLRAVLSAWLDGDVPDPDPLWTALRDDRAFPDSRLPDTGVGLDLERRLSPVFVTGQAYGTRASTVIAIDHHQAGWIAERRYGPGGGFLGETVLRFRADADAGGFSRKAIDWP